MTTTPDDLVIHPRNLRFKPQANDRWWLGGDPVATAWMNSLSASFPLGEAFFIQSVKRFREQVPPRLAAEIEAFASQEAYHTREHAAFNDQVRQSGYDLAAVEAGLAERFALARENHPVVQLCITTALEHFTAIFAHLLLKRPEFIAGAPEEARRLWSWHAIEEVEHKAVAFDTYRHVTRALPAFKRWALRCKVFWTVSRQFVSTRCADALGFMQADGIVGLEARRRLFWHLFGYPGMLRCVFPLWLGYFRPGFHPWDHDDRNLLAKAEQSLNLAAP